MPQPFYNKNFINLPFKFNAVCFSRTLNFASEIKFNLWHHTMGIKIQTVLGHWYPVLTENYLQFIIVGKAEQLDPGDLINLRLN